MLERIGELRRFWTTLPAIGTDEDAAHHLEGTLPRETPKTKDFSNPLGINS